MKETILISIIIIFIYIYFFLNKKNFISIESYNGTKYMVYNDNLNKDKANLLATIVKNMCILKNYLIKNIDTKELIEYKSYIKQLDSNFNENRTSIYETDPNSNLTSYSVNKGEELSVCLKSKNDGKLHEINLLMYVIIHEMAHFACPEIGHGDLFQKIFKKFIEVSIKLKIYSYEDYNEKPIEYCGMILSSNVIN
jgi:predicted metal-dependent hydrolase